MYSLQFSHHLSNRGPDWDTKIGGISGCTVKDLLIELYEKACAMKRWWLVRYTAGMVHKRMASLGSVRPMTRLRLPSLSARCGTLKLYSMSFSCCQPHTCVLTE